jgi:hypothetical protein
MKTLIEYKLIVNSNLPADTLIENKMKEEGHTNDRLIYSAGGFDCVWTDSQGNEVTSGYRLTADRKNNVLVTIVNSYKKDLRDKATKLLTINND